MTLNDDTQIDNPAIQNQRSFEDQFAVQWLSNLIGVLDDSLEPETRAKVIKSCSVVHYRVNNMDDIVSQFGGNLDAFCQFLSEKWGWKIDYDPTSQIITADENKTECVCPLVTSNVIKDSASLCYCSEGFAERMFSAVVGRPVQARVKQSILRGAKTCVYTIQIP